MAEYKPTNIGHQTIVDHSKSSEHDFENQKGLQNDLFDSDDLNQAIAKLEETETDQIIFNDKWLRVFSKLELISYIKTVKKFCEQNKDSLRSLDSKLVDTF